MKDLRQIIQIMPAGERRFVQHYYAAAGRLDEKRLRLFDLIVDRPEINMEEAAKRLYGKNNASAFRKLKSRLKKDLLNLLLIRDPNAQSTASFRSAESRCRRLMYQGDVLLKRGAVETGIRLFKKAQKIAVSYELVAEQFQIEDMLRIHAGYRKGLDAFEDYTESIHRNLALLAQINKARESNYRILLPHTFQRNLGPQYQSMARKAVDALQEAHRETGSPNVGYYALLASLYYYDLTDDHTRALESARVFLDLIEREPAIHSEARVANANMQIANILMNQGAFGEAIPYAREAVQHFVEGRNNALNALELLFFAAFRANHIEEAEATLEKAHKHPRLSASLLTKEKWQFYQAGLAFVQGRHDRVQRLLHSMHVLLRDSAGWLFGHKLLELMSLIEQEQYELIDYRLEAFRKLIQRQRKQKVDRMGLIHKVLVHLHRERYDFQGLRKELEGDIHTLQTDASTLAWGPMGFEIVPFHNWLQQKLNPA